jgi:hypothetical protein
MSESAILLNEINTYPSSFGPKPFLRRKSKRWFVSVVEDSDRERSGVKDWKVPCPAREGKVEKIPSRTASGRGYR